MDDLKPCPFCGYEDTKFRWENSNYHLYLHFVECDVCGARGPSTLPVNNIDNDVVDSAQKAAVEAWNKRYEP